MKKRSLLFSLMVCTIAAYSQRSVLKYPIEFSKGTFEKKDYDSYYLNDPVSLQSVLILKDNKKAEYLLLDKNLKLVSKFSPADGLAGTVFNHYEEQYLGGTAGNGKFYFVYEVTDKKIVGSSTDVFIETLDMTANTVVNRKLYEAPKSEKPVAIFSNYGQFYSITANNESGELIIRYLNTQGELIQKSIAITVPAKGKKDKLSEYLSGLKVININDEAGLETGTEKVKLFHFPDKLVFVINNSDDPTRMIMIDTNTFSKTENSIDHNALLSGGDKGKSYVNSFLSGDKLFSLILNKKNIQVAVYDINSGKQLRNFEFTESSVLTGFAKTPVQEERKGKSFKEKEIDDVKKLIKLLDKGSEAIIVSKGKQNRFIITVGTYDPINPPGSAGSFQKGPDTFEGVNRNASGGATPIMRSTPYRWVPGSPIHASVQASYYSSTNFKIMLDSTGVNMVRGAAPVSVNEQVKSYLNDADPKADAKNQFSINQKQYFGYYSREQKTYLVEEIYIRK